MKKLRCPETNPLHVHVRIRCYSDRNSFNLSSPTLPFFDESVERLLGKATPIGLEEGCLQANVEVVFHMRSLALQVEFLDVLDGFGVEEDVRKRLNAGVQDFQEFQPGSLECLIQRLFSGVGNG